MMSFSSKIKEELSKMNNLANKQAVKAELIGYFISSNTNIIRNKIRYSTENEYNINRFHKLLMNLNIDYTIELQGKVYTITCKNIEWEEMIDKQTKISLVSNYIENIDSTQKEILVKSIVRGSFLGGGSLNNPNNTYHLEILFSSSQDATVIGKILREYGIQTKQLQRKKSYSIYVKDAEEISKLLAFIGANKAVLEFEEIRVVRETRNTINRLVNCETANLNKTVNASVEQINAIRYLQKQKRFEELSNSLKEMAKVRLENPNASLVELGNLLQNPIGKSGVNHRLKKICEIAEELKKES